MIPLFFFKSPWASLFPSILCFSSYKEPKLDKWQIHLASIDICGCNGGSIIYVRNVKAARLSYC